jgi:hypothetical protein
MGNRIKLRNIPAVEQGTYGLGSFDIKHLKMDFLESNTLPSYQDIIDIRRFSNGSNFSDSAYVINNFKGRLISNQSDYLLGGLERKERRSITDTYNTVGADARGSYYGNIEMQRIFYGGIKPDSDTSWIDRKFEGYPMYNSEKRNYTTRIASFEDYINNYISDNERQNENSKIFKRYKEVTEQFPTVTSRLRLYPENSGYNFLPDYVESLSNGDLIMYGPNVNDIPENPFANPLLTPGFYKVDPETGDIDTTFFIKNANGSRGVLNVTQEVYGMYIANDCIFLDANDPSSSVIFDDETTFSSRIYKIGFDGTLDETFFPSDFLEYTYYDQIWDISFVNGCYYLSFWHLRGDYGTYISDGNVVEILKVDEDGSNPVKILGSNQLVANNVIPVGIQIKFDNQTEIRISSLNGKPAFMEDGSIIAAMRDNTSNINIYRILPSGEFDLEYTFKDITEFGDSVTNFNYIGFRYNFAGFEFGVNSTLLSDGSLMVWHKSQGNQTVEVNEVSLLDPYNDINQFAEGRQALYFYNNNKVLKVGKPFKILTGQHLGIDFEYNSLNLYSNNGERNCEHYKLSVDDNITIRSVKELNGKIYLSLTDFYNGNTPIYRSYNDNIFQGYSTSLVRINLDGSVDTDFSRLSYGDMYSSTYVFEKNSKLFIFMNGNNKVGFNEMWDAEFGMYNNSKIPIIGKQFGFIDPHFYTQDIFGQWSYDESQDLSLDVFGSILEINEDVLQTITYTSAVKGDNAHSIDGNKQPQSLFADLEIAMYNNDFLGGYDQLQTWYDTEDDIWNSTNNSTRYVRTKYFVGLPLTPCEEKLINYFHSGIIEYFSDEKWNRDMFNQEWFAPNEELGYSGYNPFLDYVDYISLNATKDMSISEIVGAGQFNILSSVNMPVANINKLIDGNAGDIFWSIQDSSWYVWNPRSSKWESTLSDFISDIYLYEVKNRLMNKISDFKEINMANSPFTFSNFHIPKANLDEYLQTIYT